MKGYFQTYREFTKTNNWWRKSLGKEKNHKVVIAIYYPFSIVGVAIIYLFLFWAIAMLKDSSKVSYRNSRKYKKVIKEGILFDTVEYHER